MLSKTEKQIVKQSLEDCSDVQQMFDYLSRTFDLKNARPGMITKGPFIDGIIKGIDLLNAKLK